LASYTAAPAMIEVVTDGVAVLRRSGDHATERKT
jgi:hypothetical protein